MPRRREVPKREILPDPKYGSTDVAKFVNVLMTAGKKSVAERILYGAFESITKKGGKDPLETLLDILVEDHGFTYCAVFGMREDDVTLALQQPWVSVDNDSEGTAPDGPLSAEHPHPRAYGTFPRILRKYVREEHALTLEDAIRKFTALPASRMRIGDRGLVKEGLWADIVIFDPETIADRSTFDAPNALAIGMQWVLVNGVPVIADGKMTGARPGRVLRGPGYRPTAAPVNFHKTIKR